MTRLYICSGMYGPVRTYIVYVYIHIYTFRNLISLLCIAVLSPDLEGEGRGVVVNNVYTYIHYICIYNIHIYVHTYMHIICICTYIIYIYAYKTCPME